MSGYDNDPNSIFRASRTVKNIINKKLKKDEQEKIALQQQPLQTPSNIKSSNLETDVNKNLSLFTLNIKQLTTLIDSFVDYIDVDYNDNENERFNFGNMTTKEINDENPLITPEERELLGGAKKNKYSRKVRRDIFTSKYPVVKGSNIHSAPIGEVSDSESEKSEMWARDVSTESDSDSEYEGSVDSRGSRTSSSTGEESSRYGDGGDGDDGDDGSTELHSDSDSDSVSNISDLTNVQNKNKNKNINLLKELNRISNLIQHAFILWDDNITPNILYISKDKLNNFLNSNTMKNFKHSIAGLKLLSVSEMIGDYPELVRTFTTINQDVNDLLISVIRDVKRVSGINTGTISETYDPKSVEKTYIGAGFLHFPSPYNNYMNHSKTKYLM